MGPHCSPPATSLFLGDWAVPTYHVRAEPCSELPPQPLRSLRIHSTFGTRPEGMGFGLQPKPMKSIQAILATPGAFNEGVEITLPLSTALWPVIERAMKIVQAAKLLQLDTVATSNPFGGHLQLKSDTGARTFQFTSVSFDIGVNKQTVLVFLNGEQSVSLRPSSLGYHLLESPEAVPA